MTSSGPKINKIARNNHFGPYYKEMVTIKWDFVTSHDRYDLRALILFNLEVVDLRCLDYYDVIRPKK